MSGEKHKHEDDHCGENDPDQAFSQYVERNRSCNAPTQPTRWPLLLVGDQEQIEAQSEPHSDDDVRNQKPRVDIEPRRSHQYERGVEPRLFSKVAAPENE